jgi:DNA modification methylase
MPCLRREEKGSLSEMLELNKIYNMDCMEGLKQLDDNSINCCVTSPPYWGLRDYGVEGQLGLESTPEEYVAKMVEVFREVKRVLKKEGTLWLNLGDSYAGSGKGAWDNKEVQKEIYVPDKDIPQCKLKKVPQGLKPKDLVGIPWMVAFALRADGWYLRQDIIWHKPNPMPESVTDRCTKSHEYIFLLTKSAQYYYDNEAIREPYQSKKEKPRNKAAEGYNNSYVGGRLSEGVRDYYSAGKRNKRSVWTVTTKPFKEAHFATFPPDLIKSCILAGCPKDGIVLDPFMGSGTTGMVAAMYQRNFIGFELSPEYCKMAEKRIEPYLMQQTIFELLKGGQP